MVELKVNGNIYKAMDITWHYDWTEVFNRFQHGLKGAGAPKSLVIHFKNLYYYTPAPPSKHKKDKIWGECRKPKPTIQKLTVDLTKTIHIGTQKFRLSEEQERLCFINYFNTLNSLDNL